MKKWLLFFTVAFLAVAVFPEICPSEQETGIREVKVMRVKVGPVGSHSLVILQDIDEERAIPIWIGFNEANAISLEINGVVPPRPMTHDLIKSIIEGLHAQVEHVLINDVKQNIIYARIVLILNGKKIPIDSRPSDGIALALRVKAKIFVTDDVYQKLSIDLKGGEKKESELSV